MLRDQPDIRGRTSRNGSKNTRETHFAEGLRTILDKVRSLIPAQALDYFRELDETLYVRRSGIN